MVRANTALRLLRPGTPIIKASSDNVGEMTLRPYRSKHPEISPDAFVDPAALLIGDVRLGPSASVWPGAIIRADDDCVEVCAGSAVMDMAFLEAPEGRPVRIGEASLISHAARLHGCTVEEGTLVGIGAIVLDGAVVGSGAIVAAGSVVTPGTEISPGSVVVGAPAKFARRTTQEDALRLQRDLEALKPKMQEYREWATDRQQTDRL